MVRPCREYVENLSYSYVFLRAFLIDPVLRSYTAFVESNLRFMVQSKMNPSTGPTLVLAESTWC